MTRAAATLPPDARGAFKDPLGPVYTDTQRLLADAGSPIIAVGDVVTYHLVEAGETPAVALVDERTERSPVDDGVAETLDTFEGFDSVREVSNPAATLTAELLSTLREAIESDESTLIEVDGEEDLAALPAAAIAPDGASVVYGQPGEGMVLATADDEVKARCLDLLSRMNGDTARLWTLLGVDP